MPISQLFTWCKGKIERENIIFKRGDFYCSFYDLVCISRNLTTIEADWNKSRICININWRIRIENLRIYALFLQMLRFSKITLKFIVVFPPNLFEYCVAFSKLSLAAEMIARNSWPYHGNGVSSLNYRSRIPFWPEDYVMFSIIATVYGEI